jgi:hypothetical protein
VHDLPATLDDWLAGWKPSRNPKRESHVLRIDRDTYSIFPRRDGRGWAAAVGRGFLSVTWPDAEAAKQGLYNVVRTLRPAELHALHVGTRPVASAPKS